MPDCYSDVKYIRSAYDDLGDWLSTHDSFFSYIDGLLAAGLYGELLDVFIYCDEMDTNRLSTSRMVSRRLSGRVLDRCWSCYRVERGRAS
jgi:hypothetical protein